MNVLVVHEIDDVTRDVANASVHEVGNVVANTCHPDYENEISLRTPLQTEEVNVSPPCSEYPAEIDSAVESGGSKEKHQE